jgi:ribosomal protein L11 methyltransferase
MTFTTLADRVWEREWLKDFRPMRFGQRLWICPGGQQPPADLDLSPHPSSGSAPCIIHLDPGLAFGTGTHPTTALCLEWLDAVSLQGMRIIDYGCGSGILAIAALKLGAAEALAVDIDPQALTATIDNAQRNEVLDRLTVQSVNDMQNASCDVLLANILAEPLEKLAPTLAAMVDRQGHLVLSGLLRVQAERVAAHYAPWFDMAAPAVHDEWVRLEGVRRSN